MRYYKKILLQSVAYVSVVFPAVSFAQSGGINTTYVNGYAGSVISLINTILVPLLVAVAFIVFLYGIVKYFFIHTDDAQKEGSKYVLIGIIGFVVIFSVWGIVGIVSTTLGLGQTGNTAPQPPTFGNTTSSTPVPITPDAGTDYSEGY